MYVSEYSFDHLRQADDARFSRELEARRLARERVAEHGAPKSKGGLRQFLQHIVHPGHPAPRRLSHT